MKVISVISLLLINAFLLVHAVSAQTFHVSTLDTKDGLPNNFISFIQRDSNGFLWIAMDGGGLAKYDGKYFTVYDYAANDGVALPNNYIRHFQIDSEETIWMAGNGVIKFDVAAKNVQQFLPGKQFYRIFEDSNHYIWAATRTGLFKLNRSGELVNEYMTGLFAEGIFEHDGIIYFSTTTNAKAPDKVDGIYRIYNNQIELIYEHAFISVARKHDSESKFWLGYEGLYLFDADNNKIDKILDDYWIIDIHEYEFDTLWLGTINNGLLLFDTKTKKIKQHFKLENTGDNHLSSNQVNTIEVDDNGLIWIGTSHGVNKIKPSFIKNYLPDRAKKIDLPRFLVMSFAEDSQGIIWIGTFGGGLSYLNPKNNEIHHIQTTFGDEFFSVRDIAIDDNDNIWVVGDSGVHLYDAKAKIFKEFNEYFSVHPSSNSIEISKSGKLLLGTFSNGFIIFDPESKQSTIHRHDPSNHNTIMNDTVKDVRENSSGNLLVSTALGLSIFDPDNKTTDNYPFDKDKPGYLSFIPHNTYVDSRGTIWVNTREGGLNRIVDDNSKLKFWRYSKQVGLVHNNIAGIMEDQSGYLWITTRKGLSRYDSKNDQFLSFDAQDYLLIEDFTPNGIYRSKSGKIYIGAHSAVVELDPDQVAVNRYIPSVRITDIVVDYQTVDERQQLELSYQNRNLQFEFVSLDLSAPEKNLYAYRLEGFDDDWVYSGHTNKATYTGLPAGSYTFMAKGSNSQGVWSPKLAIIDIKVIPPWWANSWAYAAYLLILLMLVYTLVRYRTYQLRKYALQLQKDVNQRTQRIKELLDSKNTLFSHVSHELRTPLTLILGPLARVLKKPLDEKTLQDISLARRNSQRLLKMVDQLLLLSRVSTPGLLDKEVQNLKATTELILMSVKPLADDKNIMLECSSLQDTWIEVIPDAIESILLNLCVNAVKYTPAWGKVNLVVKADSLAGMIMIEVSDTGDGIPEKDQERIFERFTRLSQDQSGVGMGLAVVKELVEAHSGRITLASKEKQGTTFKIELPVLVTDSKKIIAHKKENEIQKEGLQKELLMECNVNECPQIIERDIDDTNGAVQSPTILVIDDTVDMCNYIRSIVEDAGYVIEVAHNGEDGLSLAKEKIPDLILCDIMMPGIDGYEVITRLRSDNITSHIPIILLTAKDDKESRLEGYDKTADDYITKPFDTDELLGRIKSVLLIRELIKQRNIVSMQTGAVYHEPPSGLGSRDQEFLKRLKEIIEENYKNSDLSVERITETMNMSERSFQRKCRALLGMQPVVYLRTYRLERAVELLKNGDYSVKELAYHTGFSSASYFTLCFKAYFGIPPKEFIEKSAGLSPVR